MISPPFSATPSILGIFRTATTQRQSCLLQRTQRDGSGTRRDLLFILSPFFQNNNSVPTSVPIPFTLYVRQSSRHSRVRESVEHPTPTADTHIATPGFSRSPSFSKVDGLELSTHLIRFPSTTRNAVDSRTKLPSVLAKSRSVGGISRAHRACRRPAGAATRCSCGSCSRSVSRRSCAGISTNTCRPGSSCRLCRDRKRTRSRDCGGREAEIRPQGGTSETFRFLSAESVEVWRPMP